MCLKREGEGERQLHYKSVVLRLERRRGLLCFEGGKKNKKKQEREKKFVTSFLPSRSTKTKAKVYFVYLQHTRSLFITTRSLARYYTQTDTCATNLSLSLATAENQHYYHHYHHRSIEEHEGGSDVFFPKHTLMCPPCSNILKNTAWKPKECAASTPLTLSW